ncbi:hypothetical protein GCM10027570_39360 [Streptomonospora sediminis]
MPTDQPTDQSGGRSGAQQPGSGGTDSSADTAADTADPGAAEARAIAARVRAVPGVAELSAGPFATAATPEPGGRVVGVAVRETDVEVGVVVLPDRPIPDIAADIRAAVGAAARGGGGRAVHVTVADLAETPGAGSGNDRPLGGADPGGAGTAGTAAGGADPGGAAH